MVTLRDMFLYSVCYTDLFIVRLLARNNTFSFQFCRPNENIRLVDPSLVNTRSLSPHALLELADGVSKCAWMKCCR